MTSVEQLTKVFDSLPAGIRAKFAAQVAKATPAWNPAPGPQTEAYESEADLLLYGGQAGGGKSSLLTGLALTAHRDSLIMRRQYSDLGSMIEDTLRQYGTRDGFSGQAPARLNTRDDRRIDFGGCLQPGDEESWKGRPHDLICLDETSQFLESQVRYLMGWNRPARDHHNQRCRVVLATNPPENLAVGGWLRSWEWFGAWLDPNYPNPAKPGELRWFISDVEGKFREVDGPEPVMVGNKLVTPKSRTFIAAAVTDNPYMGQDYISNLDGLPEPLRSAVRDGNWMIAHEDHDWQLIPTNWVLLAQQRWSPVPPQAPMCAIGVDVAQGGANDTVLAPRYDWWFDELIVTPGRETPTGSDVAALIMKHRRNGALPIIDMGGGYGGAAFERLDDNGIQCGRFLGSAKTGARTKDRSLAFVNKRAEAYWRFREALDPDQPGGADAAIPPDPELLADLTSARYEVTPQGIKVEAKQDIIKRLGRSPDRGDAVVMAWSDGPEHVTHGRLWQRAIRGVVQPRVMRGHDAKRRRRSA